MQQLPPQLGDRGHDLSLGPESRIKRRFQLFSRLGLVPMRIYIAARRSFPILQLAVVVLCATATMSSQAPPEASPLSLQQAASIALEKNPLRKAAQADTKAASAGVREAQSFLMPRLTFSELATRGNDPVYVFGSKLRQQRFTTNDFAPNELNTPLPFGNFSTRFGGTWNLFDSFASWHGVSRAKEMNTASTHQLERTDQEILFRVVQAYYGVLFAAKQLEVSDQAEKTAKSIMDRSQARYESGVVVESDLLSAKVRMASREQELIRARNNLELARAQLNTAMGVPADALYQPGDPLAEPTLAVPSLGEMEQKALTSRPDLKRIESEQSAQQLSVSIAKSSFGPRLNAFAGWEIDNPTLLAGGGGGQLARRSRIAIRHLPGWREKSSSIARTRNRRKDGGPKASGQRRCAIGGAPSLLRLGFQPPAGRSGTHDNCPGTRESAH